MKTWQVLGSRTWQRRGLSGPVQVLLVMLKSGPEDAERLTFWLMTKVKRHRGAGAADWGRGEDDIAAEFACDAVAGVGEGEVAEAVDGDAAGALSGVLRAELPSWVGL